jgi:hypothetical protein
VVVLLPGAAAALWGSSRLAWTPDIRALVSFALLALAGVAGSVAVGGWLRRVIGGVLALAGVGAGCLAVLTGDTFEFSSGRILALLGAVLLLVAGGTLVRFGAVMPRLGGSYQTPGARRRSGDPDKALWMALSEGDDPTTDDG